MVPPVATQAGHWGGNKVHFVSAVLGNVREDAALAADAQDWGRAESGGMVERITLDVWQAQKARLRVRGDQGHEFGFGLPRGTVIRDGDVLWRNASERHLAVAHVPEREVLTIRLLPQSEAARLTTALKLGHLLGNQHWPVRLQGDTAYVPVLIDRTVMETVLRTHALSGITFAFGPAPADVTLPLVFPSLQHTHEHTHPAPHSATDGPRFITESGDGQAR